MRQGQRSVPSDTSGLGGQKIDSQDNVLARKSSVNRGERVELVLEQVGVLGVKEPIGIKSKARTHKGV